MNNGPPKYVKTNGVTKLNPEYKRWKEAFGSGSPEEGNKVSKVQVNLYASKLVCRVVYLFRAMEALSKIMLLLL
jgi:hypothetical protein